MTSITKVRGADGRLTAVKTDPAPRADDIQEGGDHYRSKDVQPWTAMESWMSDEEFVGFLRGNAIKYLARCNDKGGLEDLKKARHYLAKLIEKVESL